jgi:hypothetical protein
MGPEQRPFKLLTHSPQIFPRRSVDNLCITCDTPIYDV